MTRFARFAWALLGYDVAVVAWGAYVRATGSGAGCGRHWPLCNGEVVPHAARIETVVELSHRLSSGGALIATAVLAAWAWRAYPRGHRVRHAALAAAGLMVAEALIGAGLVLFELVAHDASAKRALSVSLHLTNTLLLLAATSLTAWWASPPSGTAPPRNAERGSKLRRDRPVTWAALLPLVAMFAVGVSGAIAALGDTLFPAASLSAGFAQDTSPTANAFLRLRALHPVFAATTAGIVLVCSGVLRSRCGAGHVQRLARTTSTLVLVQVGAGLLNLALLAPVWLQLAHLVLADAVWIALVLAAATALDEDAPSAQAATEGAFRTPGPLLPREPAPPDRRARPDARAGEG